MTWDDALFNWLSIKKVAEQRPADEAASDTLSFFTELLTEDHQTSQLHVLQKDGWYIVTGDYNGEAFQKQFRTELVDALWQSIEAEPKYNC
ncbi:hypothetical protein A374_12850 [Fictibacillus macauensis ZFHKF-1]|uniref:Uncharacterized protein n=1 Tax=Fictibacillus macauensis ZFHKF-1 TaxID=1196324 RepID=I8UDD6_9BACL|nr:hypothetical protein [Fictibacillus macauensis]EIT84935.1 hypothetical protein A374_12850 [Fictibacillus macauensis ZFHKF-1]